MSNKKNIASILMLGATTVGLTGSTSTSAGLFDFLNWKEAKARDDKKEAQGYETAKNVAKIFLEHFGNDNKKTSDEKNKDKNNVMAILEDLVLEKFNENELKDYYKKNFENMPPSLNLNGKDISKILDDFGNFSAVKGELKNKGLEIIEIDKKGEKKEYEAKLNEIDSNKKNVEVGLVDMDNSDKKNFKKKEKFSFLGCLGKAIGSIKSTVVGNKNTFDLKLYNNDKDPINISITYTKTSDLKKYMRELEEKMEKKLLENNIGSEVKEKIFDLRLRQIDTLIDHAKEKGVSYEKIINTFFKKLDVKGGGLLFSNNPLTETLWKKSSKNSEIVGGKVRVLGLKDEDKEILHELGYEKNNSRVLKGVRWVGNIALTAVVVAGLSAAFPVIAGIAAAPIGVALTGVVATVVDRVAFKTRFKEYRKIESWNPNNWEVQRFLKDTVRNTITSAMWALSVTPILSSIF